MIGDITSSTILGKQIFFESSQSFFGILGSQTGEIIWIKEKSDKNDKVFVIPEGKIRF